VAVSKPQCRNYTRALRWAATLAFSMATVVTAAVPAAAAQPDFAFDLPAGVACPGFALHVEGSGDKRIERTFVDRNGNVVRLLAAGKGFALTFVNLSTGETLQLPSNGSVTRTTVNVDGTVTVQSTGHNVLILFPSDVPAGPSTTQYVGRIVYTVDAQGVFTLQTTSGRATDICALLS